MKFSRRKQGKKWHWTAKGVDDYEGLYYNISEEKCQPEYPKIPDITRALFQIIIIY